MPLYPDTPPASAVSIRKAKRDAALLEFFKYAHPRLRGGVGLAGGAVAAWVGYEQGYGIYAFLMGYGGWVAASLAVIWSFQRLFSYYNRKVIRSPWATKLNYEMPSNYFGELNLMLKIHPQWMDVVADWAIQNHGTLRFRHLLELRRWAGLRGEDLIQYPPRDCFDDSGVPDFDVYADRAWEDIAQGELVRVAARRQLEYSTSTASQVASARRL